MYINSEHKKAQELMDEQKYEKALVFFNKALVLNPNHPDILSHRGVLYLHLNQKRKCFDDLELSLNLDKDYAYRYACLAYAREFFGDLDSAIELYEKAVVIDPDDAISHNNLGLLREKKGYQKQAQHDFDKADLLAEKQKDVIFKMDESDAEKEDQPAKIVNPLPKPGSLNIPIGEKLQPKKLEPDVKASKTKIMIDVFTKKSKLKEFIDFVKNGFKLKEEQDD